MNLLCKEKIEKTEVLSGMKDILRSLDLANTKLYLAYSVLGRLTRKLERDETITVNDILELTKVLSDATGDMTELTLAVSNVLKTLNT